MVRSRALTVCVIASVSITPALAKCELSNYVFKDQKGVEAVVKGVRECFAWYDREVESRSSTNTCRTEDAVGAFFKKYPDRVLRFVGTRVITISYKGKRFNIIEDAIVGVPWLSYSVEKYTKGDYNNFKISRNVYKLLSTGPDEEMEFDFTENAPQGFGTPRELFKSLLGKKFIYSRCVS